MTEGSASGASLDLPDGDLGILLPSQVRDAQGRRGRRGGSTVVERTSLSAAAPLRPKDRRVTQDLPVCSVEAERWLSQAVRPLRAKFGGDGDPPPNSVLPDQAKCPLPGGPETPSRLGSQFRSSSSRRGGTVNIAWGELVAETGSPPPKISPDEDNAVAIRSGDAGPVSAGDDSGSERDRSARS